MTTTKRLTNAEGKLLKDANLSPSEILAVIAIKRETYEDVWVLTEVSRNSDREGDVTLRGYQEHTLPKQEVTIIENGTSKKVTLGGSPTRTNFSGWLVLQYIHDVLDWCSPEIACMTDYANMAFDGDWSGVRDTDREKLYAIYDKYKPS